MRETEIVNLIRTKKNALSPLSHSCKYKKIERCVCVCVSNMYILIMCVCVCVEKMYVCLCLIVNLQNTIYIFKKRYKVKC